MLEPSLVFVGVVVILTTLTIIAIFTYPVVQQWRREHLKCQPLSPAQQTLLAAYLPLYDAFDLEMRRRWEGHIQILLAEKQFIGCRGLQVTAEMRLIVVAVAALLLLNERGQYFPKLRSILLYPDAYIVREAVSRGHGIAEERLSFRTGESWTTDQVLLSWAQVQYDLAHWRDGQNLVLHEFAHQLDQEDGTAEGVPVLARQADYRTWGTVMRAEYQRLRDSVAQGEPTILNPYGSTHPAEFFAVATETFFEKPEQLLAHHPALYGQLQRYYQLDPLHWYC
jgi:hypothetical protein